MHHTSGLSSEVKSSIMVDVQKTHVHLIPPYSVFEYDCLSTDILAKCPTRLCDIQVLFEEYSPLNVAVIGDVFPRCDSLHSAGWISTILG